MEPLSKFLSTAAISAGSFWAGVPAGKALGLPLLLSGIATVLGTLAAVALIILAGDRFGPWIRRHLGGRGGASRRFQRLERVWEGYGVPGVALLAPLITGTHLGTALALYFGAPPGPLLRWMTLSIMIWGALFTGAEALGLTVFHKLSIFHGCVT